MPVTRPQLRSIGHLVQACEAGRKAAEQGLPPVLPKRFWNSKKLERAYWAGYDTLARRYEGATDGPAR